MHACSAMLWNVTNTNLLDTDINITTKIRFVTGSNRVRVVITSFGLFDVVTSQKSINFIVEQNKYSMAKYTLKPEPETKFVITDILTLLASQSSFIFGDRFQMRLQISDVHVSGMLAWIWQKCWTNFWRYDPSALDFHAITPISQVVLHYPRPPTDHTCGSCMVRIHISGIFHVSGRPRCLVYQVT